MNTILTDLSPEAMATANLANLYAATPVKYDMANAETHKGEDVCWCVTDISLLPCNTAFKTRLRPEAVDSTIETIIEKATARNVPFRWLVTKDTEPADLGEHLVAHGFTSSGEGPMMAVDLRSLARTCPLPTGVTIAEVNGDDEFEAWCRIAAECFGIPPDRAPALSRWFRTTKALRLPMRFYLAHQNHEPVATSQLFVAEGVAGIYYVATLPKARNQGIGYAVTHRALRDGQNMGYRAGTLQASKMGVPVYLRMGFTEVGRIRSYVWRKTQ